MILKYLVGILLYILIITKTLSLMGQTSGDTLPYVQIPNTPENYTSGTVISRMIDGLGYRYYWATEGLREEDLAFQPSEEAQSSFQTIVHIYE
ncbi:hypothetical protein NBT05_12020 [Aquimarina sp. ERC-38]|uniref:hypothetical protein n=1 Tax=Aquimarina sp. ERC-38 TaxID=2949996 RepID=UPI00224686D5|nr:hypothetical protein [Aquimarina sp. ERC-38]UZO79678.1 hypothetical protein NBT05_12020 [Aquimarina sp. ERC-38]